jgi:MFS family permease
MREFFSGARTATNASPYLLKIRSSKAFILTTVCVAVFTDLFLYGVIVPVLPFALSTRAGIDHSSVQSWNSILLAAYGAAMLIFSPFAGWFADRSASRRLPLLFGLIALGGATAMLCFARTVALLVIGRILQGLSASCLWVIGTALIVDTVGEKEIGQTLGWVGISMSLGILISPLLGGVVYGAAGYFPVYYMCFGLITLDIILRLALIEKKIARQWLDEPADLDISDTPTGSVEEKAAEEPPANIMAPAPVIQTTRKNKYPPVLTLLKSRRLVTALWGCTVQGSQMTAFDSVVPLFTQRTFHWNSTGAGLVFLAITVPGFAAPLVGAISDRYGPRWLTVTGFVISIPFWVLLRLVTHDSMGQKVLFCALLALIGLSLCLVIGPLMAEITYVVEAKEKRNPGCFGPTGAYAQAYGLFVTAFAAGTMIGPLWSGYVLNSAGWGTMTWSLGILSIAGAVPCLIWTGGLITENNAKSAEERAVGQPAASRTDTVMVEEELHV